MISVFTRPMPVVLAAMSVACFAWPIAQPFHWAMYAVVIFAAGVVGFARFTGAQSSALSGTLFVVGSLAALKAGNALLEAYILMVSGIALVSAAIVAVKTRSKHQISQPALEAQLNQVASRPYISEILAARDAERKLGNSQPRWISPTREKDFRSIIGMKEFKDKLLSAGIDCRGPNDQNGILLHGEPGDGKTMLAKALAGELGVEFVAIQSQTSQWVGQETEIIFNQLNEAVRRGSCLVFFDEADTLLGTRRSGEFGGKTPEMNAMVNRLLTFLVDHRKSGVTFVAATNFLNRIDPAMRRPGRFDFIMEVPSPDFEAREGLLVDGLQLYAPSATVSRSVLTSLAKRWSGFNAATVVGVTKLMPAYLKEQHRVEIGFDDLMAVLRIQQGLACRVPESTKSFSQMAYQPEQAKQIGNLIDRIDKSFEIEESGGEAPSGVLFYGDAGTGKTETARMIAKESKWAFFPVSGSDLARDPDKITELLGKVKNARPAIIFIDEADDVIGDRTNSPYKAATNKLLEAMDGVNGRMSDLLWIASTNFPEASDAAIVRSGRFTEKVLFKKPTESTLISHAKTFFEDPKRQAVMAVSWEEVGVVLEGCTIADAQGLLMKAWNLTLTEHGGVDRTIPVTLATLLSAVKSVQGE